MGHRIRGGWHEAVSAAGNRLDVSRSSRMVLQLDPQVADVPVHDVALRHAVGAPEMIQNLVPRQQAARVRREQIQEALLE